MVEVAIHFIWTDVDQKTIRTTCLNAYCTSYLGDYQRQCYNPDQLKQLEEILKTFQLRASKVDNFLFNLVNEGNVQAPDLRGLSTPRKALLTAQT
uniref:AlNc14C407G11426 protein n=1 Tax=Albugo laibachii Nc14 TaxID=890382 RepID=F0WZ17_9STRA|nr:AlNc14C407G11426 [Albugo laibachii Nc14]|eukprot:CCA26732.1 AlNc14C407G11426 [Albugo laibachii Nc14]